MAGVRELLTILLHLCAYAQLGVLTRIAIGKLFGGHCSADGGGVRCVTSAALSAQGGALFTDFPANVAGSFVIGALSAGGALAAALPRAALPPSAAPLQLLFAPPGSSLQSHTPLHLGLRTGFCGSLTTFSSWMLQVVQMTVGRGPGATAAGGIAVVAALWSVFLGLCGPLLALVLGQHAALAAAWLLAPKHQQLQDGGGGVAAAANGAVSESATATAAAGSGGTPATGAPSAPSALIPTASGAAAAYFDVPDDQEGALAAANDAAEGPGGTPGRSVSVPAASGAAHVAITAAPVMPAAAAAAAAPAKLPAVTAGAGPGVACWLADAAAAAILLTLTGVSLAYCWLDRAGAPGADAERRYWWLAILFGPVGCVLRWYLSRFNATPSKWRACGGGWSWLQAGTLAANLGACCLNYVAEALLLRLDGSLSGTQAVVLHGLMVGTAGCLSTVSTWVVELQRLSLAASPMGAYKYGAASVVVAVVLGLLVYGIPAWAGG